MKIPCGKVMGHNEVCDTIRMCGSCTEIQKLRAEIKVLKIALGVAQTEVIPALEEQAESMQARIDAFEKELAPLEGRSVLDTVKYVAHLESRVVALVNICAEYDVPEEALLEAEK